jgi:ribosomal protein L37E
MRGYFGLGQLSATEKSDILNQHKSLYNGYQTMQPEVSNTQPLYVYDDISDKDGFVVNNKGEVKKYTNMGINEQAETKEVCDDCGSMEMYEGVCNECGYGSMKEEYMEGSEMCEQCGGTMKEDVCEQCGSGKMEEETGHLDDIYKVKDLNLKHGDFDYVEGGGNDYGTFKGMHKNLYKEQDDYKDRSMDDPYYGDDDDFQDYESSYTEDGMDDPDNEDDGFEDLNTSEMEENNVHNLVKGKKYKYKSPSYDSEVEFEDEFEYPGEQSNMYGFKGGHTMNKKGVEDFIRDLDDEELYEQGGNAHDMNVDDVEPAYSFDSNGPMAGDPYPVNEYNIDEPMESAWADELDEVDVSGVQGVYGDMEPAFDFDSKGPGRAGPYQTRAESEFDDEDDEDMDDEDDFEEIDEDLKESFSEQKNKITEMFNRMNKYN